MNCGRESNAKAPIGRPWQDIKADNRDERFAVLDHLIATGQSEAQKGPIPNALIRFTSLHCNKCGLLRDPTQIRCWECHKAYKAAYYQRSKERGTS